MSQMRRRPKQEDLEEDYTDDNALMNGNGTTKKRSKRNSSKIRFPGGFTQREAMLVVCSNVIVGLVIWFLAKTYYGVSIDGVAVSIDGHLGPFLAATKTRRRSDGSHPRDPPGFVEPSPPRTVTPVPARSRKTFWYDGEKISFAIARALRSRGWQRVDKTEDAHMIYTYKQWAEMGEDLEKWQRFNLIPGADNWNDKWAFVRYQKKWEQKLRKKSWYLPESYMLTEDVEDTKAFQARLNSGGAKYPWLLKAGNINQGKGIKVLAPNSDKLLQVPRLALETDTYARDGPNAIIIQKYVCNEMTWNRRKFDVRVYWLVASLDPLIVLYHDGYVRIGNSDYSENDFSNTVAHLTTHTKLGAEGKATFEELGEALQDLAARQGRTSFPAGNSAVDHVRNQMKDALGEMIEIFRDSSFVTVPEELPTDNSFNIFCADFILDNDLDVWFLEPQYGCGLDEDYYFRLEMHASLFNGMVDIFEEIWKKQEEGTQKLLPLKMGGNYEVVYADGLRYSYDGYERNQNKPGCNAGGAENNHK